MSTAEVFGVGGPCAAVAAIVGYFLSFRLSKRSSETGVVETTKALLKVVRNEQEQMAKSLSDLRTENDELRQKVRDRDDEIEHLKDLVDGLGKQNDELRRRLDALESTKPVPLPQAPGFPPAAPDGV